jgi:GTPase
MKKKHRCGMVSLTGLPNAGKSTLLNALLGTRLAIVSSKPQTTRTSIQGVLTESDRQFVFLDTPGIHRSDNRLNRRMMQSVRQSIADRDVLVYVADITHSKREEEGEALDTLRRATENTSTPVLLALNKVDRIADKREMLPILKEFEALFPFQEMVPVSAAKGIGLDDLKDTIAKYLPNGPAIFPEEYLTSQPERFLAAELIREQVLHQTRQEVPHATAVAVEKWEEEGKLTRIFATISVEREGQKKIVIGPKGALLKLIGTRARQNIERLLDRKVYLELFVRVRADWREDEQFLNELDWNAVSSTGSEK